MAGVHRLMRLAALLVFGASCWAFSMVSHAQTTYSLADCQGTTAYPWAVTSAACPGGTYASVSEAANAFKATLDSFFSFSYDPGPCSGYVNDIYFLPSAPSSVGTFTVRVDACHTPSGSMVIATRDFQATIVEGSVVSPACEAAQGVTFYVNQSGQLNPGQEVCMALGCKGIMQGTLIRAQDKTTGQWVTEGDVVGKSPGESCVYNPATDAAPDNTPGGKDCTVNGLTVFCAYDPNTNVIQSVKSTGTTGTTTTSTPSGTETVAITGTGTEITTCVGSKCTTTTSTTTTQGTQTVVVSKETEESKSDFCKSNPTSPMCVVGEFSGSCSAGHTCNGDAVMCAIARAAWEQKCSLVDGTSAETEAYATATSSAGHGLTTETLTISPENIPASNLLGESGQCIADRSVTILSQTVTVELSKVCPYLATVGNMGLAVAYLVAFALIFKAVV